MEASPNGVHCTRGCHWCVPGFLPRKPFNTSLVLLLQKTQSNLVGTDDSPSSQGSGDSSLFICQFFGSFEQFNWLTTPISYLTRVLYFCVGPSLLASMCPDSLSAFSTGLFAGNFASIGILSYFLPLKTRFQINSLRSFLATLSLNVFVVPKSFQFNLCFVFVVSFVLSGFVFWMFTLRITWFRHCSYAFSIHSWWLSCFNCTFCNNFLLFFLPQEIRIYNKFHKISPVNKSKDWHVNWTCSQQSATFSPHACKDFSSS